MVFTIVTIIFLPMSFIAAFFAINIQEFPKQDGQQSLPIAYVAKYMFGIGFGISIPLVFLAFAVDDVFDFAAKVFNLFRGRREIEVLQEDDVLSGRRYSESRYSNDEKRGERSTFDGVPRSSFQRDLSPLSDRTRLSSPGGQAHVTWARSSFDRARGRHSEDL